MKRVLFVAGNSCSGEGAENKNTNLRDPTHEYVADRNDCNVLAVGFFQIDIFDVSARRNPRMFGPSDKKICIFFRQPSSITPHPENKDSGL